MRPDRLFNNFLREPLNSDHCFIFVKDRISNQLFRSYWVFILAISKVYIIAFYSNYLLITHRSQGDFYFLVRVIIILKVVINEYIEPKYTTFILFFKSR